MPLDPAYWSNFRAEDLEGVELMLEAFLLEGSSRDRELRFGEGFAVRGRRAGRRRGGSGHPRGQLQVPLHQSDDWGGGSGLRRGERPAG